MQADILQRLAEARNSLSKELDDIQKTVNTVRSNNGFDDAKHMGAVAAIVGKVMGDNPYDPDSPLFEIWNKGFIEALKIQRAGGS